MSGAQKAGVVVLGLVGLYLLSGQGKDGDGGGFGGGGGADREPGDTIITFPEMDLSQLWGDAPVDTGFTPAPSKKDISMARTATLQPGGVLASGGFGGLGAALTGQGAPSYLYTPSAPLPTPTTPLARPKKSSGGTGRTYIPSSVYRTPTPYKPPSAPTVQPKKTYYAGPGKTWGF